MTEKKPETCVVFYARTPFGDTVRITVPYGVGMYLPDLIMEFRKFLLVLGYTPETINDYLGGVPE